MRKLQFSLLGLLGVVSSVAVGCAALAKPNEWWAMILTHATFAALFVGVLAAIYGHAARRAFWVGFAVVGWGYMAAGWANAMLSNAGSDDAQQFVTTELLEWLGERTLGTGQRFVATTTVSGRGPLGWFPGSSGGPMGASGGAPLSITPVPGTNPQALSRFMRIGHSLLAIIMAVAGGLLARAFYYRRERLAATAVAEG